MATIFYLRDADIGTTTYGTGASGNHASLTQGAVNASGTFTTTGSDVLMYYFASKPVAAFTCSGTITLNLYGIEQNTTTNTGFKVIVSRLSGGTLTTVATITTSTGGQGGANAGELATTNTLVGGSGTPSSTAFADGDQIVFATYVTAVGGSTPAGRSVNFFFNNATGNYNSYVQLTENITLLRRYYITT